MLCWLCDSAGVGRTGVFILVDTALCMLQTTVSVFPLDLLRIIRDQRPMMIQNAVCYHKDMQTHRQTDKQTDRLADR